MNYKEDLKMNDRERLVKLEGLKLFSEATRNKIDELELYMKAGILTESTSATMESIIKERLIFTEEKFKEVMETFRDAY